MGKFKDYLDSLELPPIEVGDEIKIGKFKNRSAIVTGFDTDSNGQPILKTTKGPVSLFKPRITKLIPTDTPLQDDAQPRVIIDKGW